MLSLLEANYYYYYYVSTVLAVYGFEMCTCLSLTLINIPLETNLP